MKNSANLHRSVEQSSASDSDYFFEGSVCAFCGSRLQRASIGLRGQLGGQSGGQSDGGLDQCGHSEGKKKINA